MLKRLPLIQLESKTYCEITRLIFPSNSLDLNHLSSAIGIWSKQFDNASAHRESIKANQFAQVSGNTEIPSTSREFSVCGHCKVKVFLANKLTRPIPYTSTKYSRMDLFPGLEIFPVSFEKYRSHLLSLYLLLI